jgi:gluconolactonase
MAGLERCSVLVEGLDHPEGVCVTRDGLLYAGGEAGQVYLVDIDGGAVQEVASTGGFLLGLCADAAGRLYVCDVGRRELLRVDPSDGSVELYSNGTPDRPMVNPNWPAFDAAGNLYVTDSGHWKQNDGCIFRVAPDGKTELWSEASTGFPNGSCLSEDGAWLYVLESTTPALVRIPTDDPTTREVVASLSGVPDGCALDTEGRVYVCYYRPDRIDRISPDGTLETLAEDPDGTLLSAPTNGVWIASARDRMVVGNLGRWHLTVCEWGATGIPLNYPEIA